MHVMLPVIGTISGSPQAAAKLPLRTEHRGSRCSHGGLIELPYFFDASMI
jgi:hypothetical protein